MNNEINARKMLFHLMISVIYRELNFAIYILPNTGTLNAIACQKCLCR